MAALRGGPQTSGLSRTQNNSSADVTPLMSWLRVTEPRLIASQCRGLNHDDVDDRRRTRRHRSLLAGDRYVIVWVSTLYVAVAGRSTLNARQTTLCYLIWPVDDHCCHVGTAIKHPVPDWVKPPFVIFDIQALWRSGLSGRECLDVVKNYKWLLKCQSVKYPWVCG